jgi:hypothetical protein
MQRGGPSAAGEQAGQQQQQQQQEAAAELRTEWHRMQLMRCELDVMVLRCCGWRWLRCRPAAWRSGGNSHPAAPMLRCPLQRRWQADNFSRSV